MDDAMQELINTLVRKEAQIDEYLAGIDGDKTGDDAIKKHAATFARGRRAQISMDIDMARAALKSAESHKP